MHDLTSTFSLGLAASLGIAAVTALWLSPCRADPAAPPSVRAPGESAAARVDPDLGPPTDLAGLRAQGPAAFDALLVRYRRATQRSWLDPRWEHALDTVAAQRHASVSGLYWYTDLALAQAEARRRQRPILSLRMLGDLREDLSCANSRLFRTTLYANQELATFLRDHFVLHWSSERAVPTVTIDFGDGRKLVRTTTGNSAHYVLDDQGHVLDVLPGLYAPSVFRAELTRSLALADQVRGASDARRIRATIAYHAEAIDATERTWRRVQGATYIAGSPYLLGSSALARAQRATMSKQIVEVPDLRAIGALSPGEIPDDAAAWSAVGQKVWNITDRNAPTPGKVPASMVLDGRSGSLVRDLHNRGVPRPATPAELDQVVARLEQRIVADTALNQFRLRPAIHHHIVDHAESDFVALNGWIYAELFATPSSDPWLGLLPRTDFTGLPGDGVVMP